MQNGQRVADALDGRPAFFRCDDNSEIGPEVGPLPKYLDLLNLARCFDMERLEPGLARRECKLAAPCFIEFARSRSSSSFGQTLKASMLMSTFQVTPNAA